MNAPTSEAIEAAESEFAEHRYMPPRVGPAYCTGCDWESRQIGISSDTQHATHRVAATLSAAAPIIAAQAKAEALREAAEAVEVIDPSWDSALYVDGAYHPVPDWLRARAATIESTQ